VRVTKGDELIDNVLNEPNADQTWRQIRNVILANAINEKYAGLSEESVPVSTSTRTFASTPTTSCAASVANRMIV
jgi:hypothetical protein